MKPFFVYEIDINIVPSAEEYKDPDDPENLNALLYKDFGQENDFVKKNIESQSFEEILKATSEIKMNNNLLKPFGIY